MSKRKAAGSGLSSRSTTTEQRIQSGWGAYAQQFSYSAAKRIRITASPQVLYSLASNSLLFEGYQFNQDGDENKRTNNSAVIYQTNSAIDLRGIIRSQFSNGLHDYNGTIGGGAIPVTYQVQNPVSKTFFSLDDNTCDVFIFFNALDLKTTYTDGKLRYWNFFLPFQLLSYMKDSFPFANEDDKTTTLKRFRTEWRTLFTQNAFQLYSWNGRLMDISKFNSDNISALGDPDFTESVERLITAITETIDFSFIGCNQLEISYKTVAENPGGDPPTYSFLISTQLYNPFQPVFSGSQMQFPRFWHSRILARDKSLSSWFGRTGNNFFGTALRDQLDLLDIEQQQKWQDWASKTNPFIDKTIPGVGERYDAMISLPEMDANEYWEFANIRMNLKDSFIFPMPFTGFRNHFYTFSSNVLTKTRVRPIISSVIQTNDFASSNSWQEKEANVISFLFVGDPKGNLYTFENGIIDEVNPSYSYNSFDITLRTQFGEDTRNLFPTPRLNIPYPPNPNNNPAYIAADEVGESYYSRGFKMFIRGINYNPSTNGQTTGFFPAEWAINDFEITDPTLNPSISWVWNDYAIYNGLYLSLGIPISSSTSAPGIRNRNPNTTSAVKKENYDFSFGRNILPSFTISLFPFS